MCEVFKMLLFLSCLSTDRCFPLKTKTKNIKCNTFCFSCLLVSNFLFHKTPFTRLLSISLSPPPPSSSSSSCKPLFTTIDDHLMRRVKAFICEVLVLKIFRFFVRFSLKTQGKGTEDNFAQAQLEKLKITLTKSGLNILIYLSTYPLIYLHLHIR
jgi:hypothetical protein